MAFYGGMTSAAELIAPCRALLMDMDGTLVNSNASVERAWTAWAQAVGADPQEVLSFCHGQPAPVTMRRFAPQWSEERIVEEVERHIAREVEDVADVTPMPGALELTQWLDEQDMPWAVVTNSPAELARRRLAAAGLQPPVLVTASDVTAPKPAPDPYEYAAELLAVLPSEALAVEDSPAGLAAGREAGCVTVAVMGACDADLVLADPDELLMLLREVHER
ncbi:HAD family hydrolase [Dermatophilus congolensis]|uniref:Phosphatase YfbT n=1 Tax=Dermatophilus congolensis TaxID=1863 RepID=A0AA46BPW4_9MICO|nr:HAD-IA family hydrolase [Dermatophilus congolensis]STD14122.1 Phosphatase YfbT [Dermatophilus congolensis]